MNLDESLIPKNEIILNTQMNRKFMGFTLDIVQVWGKEIQQMKFEEKCISRLNLSAACSINPYHLIKDMKLKIYRNH